MGLKLFLFKEILWTSELPESGPTEVKPIIVSNVSKQKNKHFQRWYLLSGRDIVIMSNGGFKIQVFFYWNIQLVWNTVQQVDRWIIWHKSWSGLTASLCSKSKKLVLYEVRLMNQILLNEGRFSSIFFFAVLKMYRSADRGGNLWTITQYNNINTTCEGIKNSFPSAFWRAVNPLAFISGCNGFISKHPSPWQLGKLSAGAETMTDCQSAWLLDN